MSSSDSLKPPAQPSAIPFSGDPMRAIGAAQVQPGLYIVSTPIGNLRDITLRAIDTLSSVDEVLAEDTRNARKLFDAYNIKTRLTAYHDHNGAARRPELIERLKSGEKLALISDAGTPLVSDPGWKLARDASAAGIRIIPLPGASAMLAGLVTSGLPSDRFMFCGFLPPKSGARKKALTDISDVPATLIFYESGPRLVRSLADMRDALGGDREAAVARELTKLFEETHRGALTDLTAHYEEHGRPKGEIVILVGPPKASTNVSETDIQEALLVALENQPTKVAASEIAARFNLPRRNIYELALKLKEDGFA